MMVVGHAMLNPGKGRQGVPPGHVPVLVEGVKALRVDDCGPAALRAAKNAVVGMFGGPQRWSLQEAVEAELDLLVRVMQPVEQLGRVVGVDEMDAAHDVFERLAERMARTRAS